MGGHAGHDQYLFSTFPNLHFFMKGPLMRHLPDCSTKYWHDLAPDLVFFRALGLPSLSPASPSTRAACLSTRALRSCAQGWDKRLREVLFVPPRNLKFLGRHLDLWLAGGMQHLWLAGRMQHLVDHVWFQTQTGLRLGDRIVKFNTHVTSRAVPSEKDPMPQIHANPREKVVEHHKSAFARNGHP